MTTTQVVQLTKSERAQLVAAAEHSGEMEGLSITPAMRADAAEFVDGRISADDLAARTRARYGIE